MKAKYNLMKTVPETGNNFRDRTIPLILVFQSLTKQR